MKNILLFVFWGVCVIQTRAQVNRFDVPVQSTYVSQYEPLSYDEMMLMEMGQVAKEALLKKQYEESVQQAYNYLRKGNNYWFIYYVHQALNTGYYNVSLYYNLGIVYYLENEKRKSKKYLKKAKRKGSYRAQIVLELIKKKRAVDESYLDI